MSFFSSPGVGFAEETADRTNSPVLYLQSDSFFLGIVVDCTAHYGTVRVLTAARGVILGVPLFPGTTGVFGPRRIGACYPPHTKVICYQPPNTFYCYVLGAVPDWVVHKDINKVPDWIVPGCSSGLGFDGVHYLGLERDKGKSGDINFAAGRPCDELPGDYGYINELGVSFGIGKLMAWLRASHYCGIEAFWVDNLLRLTGQNIEIYTDSSELRAFNDEGEWSEIFRWGHLPWEAKGVINKDDDFTEHGGDNWRSGKPGRVPIYDDQMGLWRVQRFRGYLGDLERTYVSLVNQDLLFKQSFDRAERLTNKTSLPGVLDIGYSANGAYHIRSAKSILLEKTAVIPVPKETKLPDDPSGDSPDNYSAAGIYGSDTDLHKKKDISNINDNGDVEGLRSAILWERHAVLYGLAKNLSFKNHKKDWTLSTEEELIKLIGLDKGIYINPLNLNSKDFWMPVPNSVEVEVDHRETTKYYAGRACIKIEEDGSIILEDAYGSQIRLEGGNIFLSARHDIVLQPGRNAQIWAPHDLILKAGNSADLTASLGDVRVKAQGNLMLYSDEKGILLESGFTPEKGDIKQNWTEDGEKVESRGIILKAEQSSVISLSKDIYLRTGVKEGAESDSEFIIDAGAGQGSLFVRSNKETHNVEDKYQIILGNESSQDSIISVDLNRERFILGGNTLQELVFGAAKTSFGHERFDRTQFFIHGDLFTRGRLFVTDNAIIDGGMFLNGSFISQKNIHVGGSALFTGSILAAGIAVDNGGGFLPSTGDDFNASEQTPPEHPKIGKELSDTDQLSIQGKIKQEHVDDYQFILTIKDLIYSNDSVFASPNTLPFISFTFRTSEQYGISLNKPFIWYEARWQQLNRLVYGITTVWDERIKESAATKKKTMPYPGYDVWANDGKYVLITPKYYDYQRGIFVNLDNDTFEVEKDSKSFASSYIVTLQKELE